MPLWPPKRIGHVGKMIKATALIILGFIMLTLPIICVYAWAADMSDHNLKVLVAIQTIICVEWAVHCKMNFRNSKRKAESSACQRCWRIMTSSGNIQVFKVVQGRTKFFFRPDAHSSPPMIAAASSALLDFGSSLSIPA